MRQHLFCALLALAATPVLQADTLRIPVGQQAPDSTSRPQLGMSMDTVQAHWGKPITAKGPVGTPPITRWEYANFHVVFEGRVVIRSVLKPAPAQDMPAASEQPPTAEPEEDLFK